MKQKIFTVSVLLCAILFSTQAFARRVYVKLHTDTDAWAHVTTDDNNLVITLPEGSTDFAGNVLSQLQAGDEVWVAKGEYENTATLKLENNVTLYGGFAGTESDAAGRATADLDNNGLVETWEFVNETNFRGKGNNADTPTGFQLVLVNNGSVLDGITLSDSYYTEKAYAAGGEIKNGGVIRNSIVRDMTSKGTAVTVKGGGLYLAGGKVENCLFESCKVLSERDAYGGGLFFTNKDADGHVANCVIRNCYVDGMAGNKGRGAGIFAQNGAIIENCVLYNNESTNHSAAIYLHSDGDGSKQLNRIIGCTLTNNKSAHPLFPEAVYVEIYNTVSWGNVRTDGTYKEVIRCKTGGPTAYPYWDGFAYHGTVRNPNNKNADFAQVTVNGAIGETNNDKSPLFKQATSFQGVATTDEQLEEIRKANWSLLEGSPLIDAGVDAPTNQLEGHGDVSLVQEAFSATDLMGNARVSKYDIGAYEYQSKGEGTGVTGITDRPFCVYVANGCITVDNLSGVAEISLYGLNGVRLSTQTTYAPRVSVPFAEKGFYVLGVQVNGKTYSEKVVL